MNSTEAAWKAEEDLGGTFQLSISFLNFIDAPLFNKTGIRSQLQESLFCLPVYDLGGCCFLQWRKLLGSSVEQVTGNRGHSHRTADIGSFSSLFLAGSIYAFELYWSLGGAKPK